MPRLRVAPSSRDGLRSRSATSHGVAERQARRPAMTGRSLPWTSRSTPTSRRTASTRALAVGGDVEEDVGIADRAAAAGQQPLAVQRRQAGEHREAHAQPRVGGPAPDGERVPRRLHRRHVVGHRRPPARRGPTRGPAPARGGSAAARRGAPASRAPGRGARSRPGRRARRPARTRRRTPRRAARDSAAGSGVGRGRPPPRRRTARAARRRPRGRRRAAARPRRRAAPRCPAASRGPPARGRGRRRPPAPRGGRDRGRRGRAAPRARRRRRSVQPRAPARRGIGGSRRSRQRPQQRLGPEMLVDVDWAAQTWRERSVKRFSEPFQQSIAPALSTRVRSAGWPDGTGPRSASWPSTRASRPPR